MFHCNYSVVVARKCSVLDHGVTKKIIIIMFHCNYSVVVARKCSVLVF